MMARPRAKEQRTNDSQGNNDFKRLHKPQHSTKRSLHKPPAQLRKSIRDIERLITKKGDSMNALVKSELERKVHALKYQLEMAETERTDQNRVDKFKSKYRKVRFIEVIKALRKARYARTALEERKDDAECEELQKALQEAELDVCYIIHYPESTKYIALYAHELPTEDKGTATRNEIRDKIREQIDTGVIIPKTTIEAGVRGMAK